MELLVLLGILALLILGPRRGGRMPGPLALAAGILFLIWLAAVFGFGWIWQALVGPISQP